MFTWVLGRYVASTVLSVPKLQVLVYDILPSENGARGEISTRTFRRALTASVDSCVVMKSAPSVAYLNLAEFGGGCRKAMLGV